MHARSKYRQPDLAARPARGLPAARSDDLAALGLALQSDLSVPGAAALVARGRADREWEG